jgi:hypothetical protein
MKTAALMALALLALVSPASGRAENPASALQSLTVQLWPDYDRPAVLVMLTGTLPSSAPLPAFVTLPLLPGAELNAVARADADGKLLADVVYTSDAGSVSLSTPNSTFRVEFYVPYRVEDGARHFSFDWLAEVSVDALSVIVQKPVAATSFATQPPAAETATDAEGLTYHVLPTQAVAAREAFSVQLFYAAATDTLSAARRPTAAPAAAATPPAAQASPPRAVPAVEAGTRLDWGLLVAIVAAAGASMGITWRIARNRFAKEVAGKTPPAAPRPARYCPGCGLPSGSSDRFCSGCGRELRVEG